MKWTIFFIFVITLIFRALPLNSAMSGGGYEISADSFGIISPASTTGSGYGLFGTVDPIAGEVSINTTSGGLQVAYTLSGGFQGADKGVLSVTLSKSVITLGTLTAIAVNSDSLVLAVSTDSMAGYTTSVYEDGQLRSGVNDINDVTDGSVTAGSEEYGIRISGVDGLLSNDAAISASVDIASSSGIVTDRQTTVTFRASAAKNTQVGSYSHAVTFSTVVNP